MKLMTNRNGSLGEQLIGTREEFKVALTECFAEWHRDADPDLSLEDYIEKNLDENLDTPTEDELESVERLNA
jgi:hypothetical protein